MKKSLCLIFILIFSFSFIAINAFAANNISTDTAINDMKLDDTTVQDGISPSYSLDENPLTLDVLLPAIELEPNNADYYKEAAPLLAGANDKGIIVFSEGKQIDFGKYDNVTPTIDSGRTLIPIRAIAESLGATVSYDDSSKTATISLSGKQMLLTIGSSTAKVGNSNITLDVPAQSINSRIVVPLRFVSENFGETVDFIPYSNDLKVIAVYTK